MSSISNPQSSGSQDSIDQLNRIFDKNTFTDERGYSEGLRDDLLAEVWAWHNTQLKAELQKIPNFEVKDEPGNAARYIVNRIKELSAKTEED